MTISATLAINEEVARRQRAGVPTVPLGFGEAGVPVHPALVEALAAAAPHAGYGPVAGIEPLRAAAAGYWQRRGLPTDPDQVVAGPGSKPLLYTLLWAAGGAVALPRPSWVSYAAQAALLGLAVEFVPTLPGEGGVPDPELLDEAARARLIRAVVLTLPDNPTGTLARPDTVAAVCAVAERHDLLIISDEIYRDLIHDPATPFRSPAEIAPERTVITTGLSKSLALGGWRLGVARLPQRELRDRVLAMASEIWSAPAQPVQQVAAWALTEPPMLVEHIAASRALHREVARAAAAELTNAGIEVPAPQAGFYLYPDFGARPHRSWSIDTSPDLAATLLCEHGIATLPGAAFGEPEQALRLRLATSQLYGTDDEQRDTALRHPAPSTLPWIAAHLYQLRAALRSLVSGKRR